jgi:hypothetical protein
MPTPPLDAGPVFPNEPEKKQRGCLFYGCIVAAVLVGLVGLLVGLASWATYRAASQFVQQYAEDAPAPIPVVEKPAPEVDAIRARIDGFSEALAAGKATGPLELSADDLNAIIAATPEFKGLVALDFSGDAIKGKVSLPLSRLGFPVGTLFGGKYLNGVATIDARVEDGRWVVTLVGLEARGKPVPDSVLASLRGQNLLNDLDPNSDVAKSAAHIESIAVKGGKLIVTPKPPGKPDEPAKAAEPAKPAEPAKEVEPEKPEPKAEPAAPQ